MAKPDDGRISNKQYTQLADAISGPNMQTIAQGYLDIDPDHIESIKVQNLNKVQQTNTDILRRWANKPDNSRPDQRRVSARTHARTHARPLTFTFTQTHKQTGRHTHTYRHTHHTHTYKHTHTHTPSPHTHAHTHTHTHTHACLTSLLVLITSRFYFLGH